MIALNSINKFETLNCQLPGNFFKGKKMIRETLRKCISQSSNTSCPFYLLSLSSKIFTALDYTNTFMTLVCPFTSPFFWSGKRAGKKYITMLPITWIVRNPFTCYRTSKKKIKALNSINRFMTLTCKIIFDFFFWWRKWAEKQYKKHVAQKPINSRPFYLWSIHSKKKLRLWIPQTN